MRQLLRGIIFHETIAARELRQSLRQQFSETEGLIETTALKNKCSLGSISLGQLCLGDDMTVQETSAI